MTIATFMKMAKRSLNCWKTLWEKRKSSKKCLTVLESAKLKEFADDNFKFHKNGRKFSKRVENTVGKGEIARNEQFLLIPQCFQKTCIADT